MQTQISIKGKAIAVPSLRLNQRTIVIRGGWLKVAEIQDEEWIDAPIVDNPASFIEGLEQASPRADFFTFVQPVSEPQPRYSYHLEWDNLAVASTSDFQAWWGALPQESRKNVRKSQKRNVVVREVKFTDDLVRGIKVIYDETPFRQGRKFWHYGKDLETIKLQNSTYLERSHFIGAYVGDELIGFLKMVVVGPTARIMQILSKNAHYDKHPTNALLAAAVELCSKRSIAHFVYGQYIYGNKRSSSVTEFKRRNGFQQVLIPRYYIPLTAKGEMAIFTGLHRGISGVLPEPLTNFLLDTRSFVYERLLPRFRSEKAVANGT